MNLLTDNSTAAKEPTVAELSVAELSEAEVRRAIDLSFAQVLSRVTAASALLFASYFVIDLFAGTLPFSDPVTLVDLVVALLLTGLRAILRRGGCNPRFAYPIGAAALLLVLVANFVSLVHDAASRITLSTMFLIVGLGYLYLSTRWLIVSLSIVAAGWYYVTHHYSPSEDGLLVVEFIGVAFVIHCIRLSAFRKLERHRHAEAISKRQLAEALEAARQEIAERERAQSKLRESEERYRQIVDLAPVAILVHREGKILFVNDTGVALLGLEQKSNIVGAPILDYIHPDYHAMAFERAERIAQGATTSPSEMKLTLPGGRIVDVQSSAGPVMFDGEPAIQAVIWDMTERHRSEEALRESEARYRLVAENLSDVIWTMDMKLNLTYISPSVFKLRGFTPEEALAMPVSASLTADSYSTLMKIYAEYIRDAHGPDSGRFDALLVELEAIHKDGSIVPVEMKLGFLRSEDGKPIGILGVTRDIRERKRAEEEHSRLEGQLRQSQKLEAIGTLAGGVAHDFNNLLTGIMGYANMLKMKPGLSPDLVNGLSVIERAGERATLLTRQLLGFARKGKNQDVRVDLHAIVDEVVKLLSRTVDKNIAIEVELAVGKVEIQGDPTQLQQVVLNLAINARDAMPSGGELTISTRSVFILKEDCHQFGMEAGPYAVLSVKDTGCGIPKEIQERVYEPFFTTKEQGLGTGMGLATVYGIVKNHGGAIRLYSEAGRGTIFNVYLPLAETLTGEIPETAGTPAPRPIHGKGKILVVEDEEVVRIFAQDMLLSLGYDATTVSDGREAVDYYAEHGREIDLVLIDMIMPKLDGKGCFRELKKLNPNLKAILTTGYSQDGAAQDLLNEGMVGFAQKPYRIQEFSEILAHALF